VNPNPAQPFLKWAGGKRQLLPQITKHMPSFKRYFEPFVGGGAVYFGTAPTDAVINDSNERLIRAYRGLSVSPDAVIALLKSYPIDKEFFLELRKKPIDDPQSDDVEVAAWLIYLNRLAFNGLYRVNKGGGFNVPWGKYKNPNVCNEDRLRSCAALLSSATLTSVDFMYAVDTADRGDLVYFDPPYVPVKEGESFTSYTKGGFGLDDHVRLRDCAVALKARGVHVMINNSNTKTVRDLYRNGFKLHRLTARSSVAASSKSRGERVDLLIV
jgi:DNA adenine methylase